MFLLQDTKKPSSEAIAQPPDIPSNHGNATDTETTNGNHDNTTEEHLRAHDTHSVPDELPPHSPHVINVQPIIVEEEEEEEGGVVVEDVEEVKPV